MRRPSSEVEIDWLHDFTGKVETMEDTFIDARVREIIPTSSEMCNRCSEACL